MKEQDYLVPSIGDKIGACNTEPLEVVMLQECTTQCKKGDKYVINGSKTFITTVFMDDYYVAENKTT
jgi:alkylation response protein AidB-like acyl-CoA dehydrogenase